MWNFKLVKDSLALLGWFIALLWLIGTGIYSLAEEAKKANKYKSNSELHLDKNIHTCSSLNHMQMNDIELLIWYVKEFQPDQHHEKNHFKISFTGVDVYMYVLISFLNVQSSSAREPESDSDAQRNYFV